MRSRNNGKLITHTFTLCIFPHVIERSDSIFLHIYASFFFFCMDILAHKRVKVLLLLSYPCCYHYGRSFLHSFVMMNSHVFWYITTIGPSYLSILKWSNQTFTHLIHSVPVCFTLTLNLISLFS